jgi:phosphopantothenoylcysteine decarboxylase/phosphopantothenate--cysteine ligase
MLRLANRRILVGITGGIAAYKTAELTRLLKAEGADVRVVMTQAASEFITPLTLQALSGNEVRHSLLDPASEAGMGHIELARWADLILIAPASADFIAKLAAGMGFDLLSTLCLATDAPLYVAPAMNQAMWHDAVTQHNLQKLDAMPDKQITWLGPDEGKQACGDFGFGRMLEPGQLLEAVINHFQQGLLSGLRLMLTAGPTLEPIDPVRYLSNHSSGKMGFALAEAARDMGAQVTLIAGPVSLETPERIKRVNVQTTSEMLKACMKRVETTDIFIAAAAVCDYRPVKVAQEKIKKQQSTLMLELTQNPDILASVSLHANRPFCVGFAAETQDLAAFAERKLAQKKLDLLVANNVSETGIGFGSDYNAATLLWPGASEVVERTTKAKLAIKILKRAQTLYARR